MPLNSKGNTLVRTWQLMRILPSGGAGKTSRQLTEELNAMNFKVSKRQVERDLNDLAKVFKRLERNDSGTPIGWRWAKGTSFNIPGMSLPDALSLQIVKDTLEPLLPSAILNVLKPSFGHAHDTLQQLKKSNTSASWPDKIRHIPSTLRLLPPAVDPDVIDCVHSALIDARQLKVRYSALNKLEPSELTLNPLGLVNQGGVQYLIATAFNYSDPRLYATHRIASAEKSTLSAVVPEGFNIDAYLQHEQGQFMSHSGKGIKLRADIAPWLVKILTETPLSKNQNISLRDDTHRLQATVPDSWQLRWWILSLGDSIRVTAPEPLAQAIRSELEKALARYEL